jgi:hypothetical protein
MVRFEHQRLVTRLDCAARIPKLVITECQVKVGIYYGALQFSVEGGRGQAVKPPTHCPYGNVAKVYGIGFRTLCSLENEDVSSLEKSV